VTRSLREFGFGKLNSLDLCLEEETLELLRYFENLRTESPSDLCFSTIFNLPVLNVIWRVMSGARFACDDKDMARLVELLKQTFAGIAVSTQPYYAFPFLRHLPGLTDFYKIVKDFQRLQDFFKVNLVVILIPNIFQDF
jgi:hypothetical protein